MAVALGLGIALLLAVPLSAQQFGSVTGTVVGPDGDAMPGVTVEADGDVLPQTRVARTDESGRFRLAQLPPGSYTVTFSLSGLESQSRELRVLLQQNSVLEVTMQPEGVTEEISVIAELAIDPNSSEIKAAIDQEVIEQVPIGQEYRDLVKLIPGVQYSEESVRGPSAGGSGQDNVYQFDGVDVGLPLFGNLSAEPSSVDIEQVSIIRGGAKALDFNRSGGFTINTISKSGTGAYAGTVSFQVQTDGMTGSRDTESAAEFDRDFDWTVLNIGGPIVKDKLFFYTSYYRPTTTRDSRSNLYGPVPDAESVRDEFFGKLTINPTESLFFNISHRESDRDGSGQGVTAEDRAGTSSSGSDATLGISILEGTWVPNEKSYVSFKYTDFENEISSLPDNVLGFGIAVDGTVRLDVNNLDQQGLFFVPQPIAGNDSFNTFITPLIERFGFLDNGVRTGGGIVGVGSTIDANDFFRESYQLGYNYLLGDNVTHDLHFGYSWSLDEEDLARTSNGWGGISVIGGRDTLDDGTPIFYEARFEQQSLDSTVSPVIHSEFETQSFEINDTINWKDWAFNVGVMFSNDTFYGQGLRENDGNLSGFELAPGNRYKMYEIDFDEMIQPRLGVTRSFQEGRTTAYASYARYHPAASSLPRAASWARNLRRSIRAFFDADGNVIGVDPVRSSSGKFFDDDLDPRFIDEFIVGSSKQFANRWTGKAHVRYRYGADFWEDTNNNARLRFEPPEGIPQELYIPELDSFRDEIGGSSYVIAELDDAFTKYWEVSTEAEWRGNNAYFRGSYVWSHYYGNFDQDNSTTSNDANVFVGSSFIADGAGRQLWNFREGNLRGDRRHQLKAFGYYNFKWNGSAGIFAALQSGQPWEAWDVEVYRNLTGSSSDTSRFAEPAGSRTTDNHLQVDLNYTQRFRFAGRYDIELRADLFNVLDEQTGYNIQNKVNSAGFGEARSFFDPRRLQLAVRFLF